MKEFMPGTMIEIPCSFEQGAFMGEYYVTIQLEDEMVSGFVPKAHIVKDKESSGYIHGNIVEVSEAGIRIRIPGSYFTTNGIADISQTWAAKNAKVA